MGILQKGKPISCLMMKYYNHWAKCLNCASWPEIHIFTLDFWIPLFVTSDKTSHNLKQPSKTNSDRDLFCHFMHQSKTDSHFYFLPEKYKFCWGLFFYRCKVEHDFLIRLSGVFGIFVALENICFALRKIIHSSKRPNYSLLLLFSYDWCLFERVGSGQKNNGW